MNHLKSFAKRSQPIDWGALRARTEAAVEEMEKGLAPDPEVEREILRKRSAELARGADSASTRLTGFEAVEFLLGQERYAVETSFVREIVSLRHFVPVPGTPSFVVGILPLRGEIISILDLKRLFDLPSAGLTDLNKVIVLREGRMWFGLLADAIQGVRWLEPGEGQEPPATLSGMRREFCRGIWPGGLVLLEARRMLADERLIVRHA